MKFIIIAKKEKFNSQMINETFLSSCNAPSLISEKFVKASMSNFDIYLYLYNQIIEENEDIYYKIEDNEINFFNGVIAKMIH